MMASHISNTFYYMQLVGFPHSFIHSFTVTRLTSVNYLTASCSLQLQVASGVTSMPRQGMLPVFAEQAVLKNPKASKQISLLCQPQSHFPGQAWMKEERPPCLPPVLHGSQLAQHASPLV